MKTNTEIINFILNNWVFIALFMLFIIRIIPPELTGFWKYNNNKEIEGKAPKISFIRFILNNLVDGVLIGVLIPILAAFEFKKMVTLLIFVVVGFDLLFNHQISPAAVTLVGIGIIALYLEKLIETGKHLKLFGGLLSWDKEENSTDTNQNKKS